MIKNMFLLILWMEIFLHQAIIMQNATRSTQLHLMVAFAGVFAIAMYILFGDSYQSPPSKKKRKRGGLPGLVNIGNSCFINCILQALASSVAYNKWLGKQDSKHATKLLMALRNVLQKLNDDSDQDTTAFEVLSALNDHKLFLSSGEQDAHELFIALIGAVNDELCDAQQESFSLLEIGWAAEKINPIFVEHRAIQQAVSVNKAIKCNAVDQGETCDEGAHLVAASAETNAKPAGVEATVKESSTELRLPGGAIMLNPPTESSSCPAQSTSRGSPSPRSGRIATRVSTSLNREAQHRGRLGQTGCPFGGSLASQLQCMFCGCKNPDQWSPFHAISLSFPTPHFGTTGYRLEDLLEIYIKKEIIELNCDKCSKHSNTHFSKQLTFGKLPECLCIHIQRNVWTATGATVKLRDHVAVSEYLDMEPFTYSNNIRKQQNVAKLVSNPNTVPRQPMSLNEALQALSSMQSELVDESVPCSGSNVYKLQAVVVHVGDAYSGHFVTYRRGSINSIVRNKWFYTSDSVVSEVSFEQVLDSNAYMIIYEKLN